MDILERFLNYTQFDTQSSEESTTVCPRSMAYEEFLDAVADELGRPLTAEELAERDILRKEYIAEWRRGAEQTLESLYIVDEKGIEHKLPKKKK